MQSEATKLAKLELSKICKVCVLRMSLMDPTAIVHFFNGRREATCEEIIFSHTQKKK